MTNVSALARPSAAKPPETDPRKAVPLRSLKVLRRAIEGHPDEDDNVEASLEVLCNFFGFEAEEIRGEADDPDPTVQAGEMDEALSRARCGQMIDCVIHLGRGLPPQYQGIADALERALGGVR